MHRSNFKDCITISDVGYSNGRFVNGLISARIDETLRGMALKGKIARLMIRAVFRNPCKVAATQSLTISLAFKWDIATNSDNNNDEYVDHDKS